MRSFPTVLRELRRQANMTQPELARRLGVSRSAVSMYESGSREPSFATIEAIASLFRVDMNTLSGAAPAPQVPGPQAAGREAVKLALFGDSQADDSLYEEVLAYAQFLSRRRKEP